jgi:hypothetical protein
LKYTDIFKYREADAKDIPFIYSTWLDSYRYDSDIGKSCRNIIFFNNYRFIIDELLENSKTLVACIPDDPEVIFGFMTVEGKYLHYAYTKHSFQRLGIANDLYKLHDSPTYYTHKTNNRVFQDFVNKREMIFDPFKLYKGKHHEN